MSDTIGGVLMKGMLGVALCLLVGCSQEVDDVIGRMNLALKTKK